MLGERNLSSALPFGRKRASLSLKVEPLVQVAHSKQCNVHTRTNLLRQFIHSYRTTMMYAEHAYISCLSCLLRSHKIDDRV